MSSEPPPIYSPEPPDGDEEAPPENGNTVVEPQILIIPTGNDVSFQRGYLGAEGERAAIEGELQLKCADSFRWERVTMSLRTVEKTQETEIELAASDVVLYASASASEGRPMRSSFAFAIPLTLDTPQCIHTSHSSLLHTLTANVYASGSGSPNLSKSVTVHTRRYTSHSYTCTVSPETKVLDDPTRVEVQVPRTTFKAGEALPIYVTVPVPRRELVVEQGLRLRNIRAELVRFVKIKKNEDDDLIFGSDFDHEMLGDETEGDGGASSSGVQKTDNQPSSSSHVNFQARSGLRGEQKVISLSGASCRLHPTRAIRIRLVLRPPTESPLALRPASDLPAGDYYAPDSVECATISQTTLLHAVSFRLRVRVAFMNMSTRTERISTVSIPIVLLPPSAPLPEVEESMDSAYHKKHDRPPTRTARVDDTDVPLYEEGEAGPSFHSGAPPPFEEREAPPPFFSMEPGASTSSRLPTFLESEREIYVPSNEDPAIDPPSFLDPDLVIEGEGELFGFPPSEQFDGHADMDRSFTPPPTVEMATRDTDVTGLANLSANVAMEALGLALGLDSSEETMNRGPPPPPPPMDDPSDPPPSIDSDFRGPQGTHETANPARPPGLHTPDEATHTLSDPSGDQGEVDGHAPPPYRVPDSENGHDHGTGPPPYVDLVHHPR